MAAIVWLAVISMTACGERKQQQPPRFGVVTPELRDLATRACLPTAAADKPAAPDDIYTKAALQRLSSRRLGEFGCAAASLVYDLDDGQLYSVFLSIRTAEEVLSWLDALERAGTEPARVEAVRNQVRSDDPKTVNDLPITETGISLNARYVTTGKWSLGGRVSR